MKRGVWLLVLTIAATNLSTFAQQTTEIDKKRKLEQFNERYVSKSLRERRGGIDVPVSLYDILLETNNKDNLGDKARQLYDDVLAIFKTPTSDAAWLRYFDDFPKRFPDFYELFCRYNRELSRGCDIFMAMLSDFIKERPQTTAGFVLGLAKDSASGPGDEMALYHLHHILVAFICDFYDSFISEFNKLGKADQDHVIRFVFYSEGAAYAFLKPDGSGCIDKKLKEKNNTELLKRFREAAKKYYIAR